jgi:hypothetical protein
MKWLLILGISLFATSSLANPPLQKQFVKNNNVIIKEQRIVDVPGYNSAVGIDILSTGSPYFYGKLADATVDAENKKQVDALANEVKSLRNELEFLKKLVLSLQQGGLHPVPEPGADESPKAKITLLLKEKNCNECHSPTDPRGKGLVIFNADDELWVRRKVGEEFIEGPNNGVKDWLKILDRVQRTPTQEGFMPKDGEALTVTESNMILKYITDEITKEKTDVQAN